MQRRVPFVFLFPPSTPLHKLLFLPLNQKSNSFVHTLTTFPDPNNYVPCDEVLVETLEYVWLRVLSSQVVRHSQYSKYFQGVLMTTSHRLVFVEYLNKCREPCRVTTIPHSNVTSVTIKRDWKDGFDSLEVGCMDGITLMFSRERRDKNDEVRVFESFQRMKVEIDWRRVEDNFYLCAVSMPLSALCSPNYDEAKLEPDVQGVDDSDLPAKCILRNEYMRLGVAESREWRISSANKDFATCASYPECIAVPSSITDSVLAVAATQRSSMRFPALTWIHPVTKAALCRCLRVCDSFV